MSKYEVTSYDTQAAAEAAMELLDTNVDASIEPYDAGGLQKWVLVSRGVAATTMAQLTAPGASAWIPCAGNSFHAFTFTVGAINTEVVLRAEGSVDGATAFNLSALGDDTTVSGNGSNAFTYVGAISHIRLNFVSEDGGTDATVDGKYLGV